MNPFLDPQRRVGAAEGFRPFVRLEGDVTIRTYRGNSPAEALSKVKKDLGSDAVILNTRTQRVGGVLGLGVKTITEITAAVPGPGQTAAGSIAIGNARRTAAAAQAARPVAPRPPVAGATATLDPGIADGRLPASRAARGVVDAVRTDTVDSGAGSVRMVAAMESEIAAIRRMVGQLVCASRTPVEGMPQALEDAYLRLLECEISSDLASKIIGTVRGALKPDEQTDAKAVRRAVIGEVARLIPVAQELKTPVRGRDGRPHTVALVGPTGVGKTTTLAKLAATWKLRHGLSVGVITADTYRIAAVDQLRVYAGIMNLQLEVVSNVTEMARACRALEDRDVVLVDTAGRSPRDAARLAELRMLIEAAAPDEVHMVVAATASPSALACTLDQFRPLGPTHTILTKLDEAAALGSMLAAVTRMQSRLSFLTTGQEVPDQIERACPDRLARWIVEGGMTP